METSSPHPATWLITGASAGLGQALARHALDRGDYVIGTFRSSDEAARFEQEFPGRATGLMLDLEKSDGPEALIQAAAQVTGRLDRIVNNSGAAVLSPLEHTGDSDLQRLLQVNLLGPLRLVRAALPLLRTQGSGHVIQISAIAAVAPEPGFVAYGAAKAALWAASDALALEVAPFGLRVTTVIPGPFRTGFISRNVRIDGASATPEYAGTVGKFGGILQRINGRQSGDPTKAAAAIYAIAGQPDAPTWLPLGRYAYDQFRQRLNQRQADLEKTRSLGYATDFGAA